MKKRILSIFLTVVMVMSSLPLTVFATYENTHTNTGNQRNDIVEIAKTQIGYTEYGTNGSKYGEWYGSNYEPWCAMFVSWCANQAGIPTYTIPLFASCTTGMNWFRSNDTWHDNDGSYTPSSGDLVFFDWDCSGDCDHVEIVEYVSGGYIHTIGGNTGNNCVERRTRSGYIKGYASPNYSGTSPSPSGESTLGISNVIAPTAVVCGDVFSFYGEITSNYPITNLWVAVYQNGTEIQSTGAKPNTYSYNIHNLDNYISFGKLSPGSYTFMVYASDDKKGEINLVWQDFIVYDRAPTWATITVSSSRVKAGSNIYFDLNSDYATKYTIGIDKDNERILTEDISDGYEYICSEPGFYSAYISATNSYGSLDSARVNWVVYNDAGNDFYAYIIQRAEWKHLENSDGNVQVASNGNDNSDPRQIWHFIQQSDGSYKIVNEYDGKCLDADNFGAIDGTNIQTYADNGSSAQRWYLCYRDNGTNIVPAYCDKVMDVNGGTANPGTNIQLWTCNDGPAQGFSVYPLTNDGVNYSKPSKPDAPVLTVSTTSGSDTAELSWTQSALKSDKFDTRTYDVGVWQGNTVSGDAYVSGYGFTDLTATVKNLPAGTYTVRVTANNTEYQNYSTASNDVVFTISESVPTYTIKYNANGGTGTMANSSHTYGTAKALNANTFTRTGYTFLGWSKSSTATSATYTDKQSVKNLTSTNGDTITLYAVWKPITYKVAYNANGGKGTMTNSIHTFGTGSALSTNAYTRTGYVFLGWSRSKTATTASYTNEQVVKGLTGVQDKTVVLYAVWKPITYSVKYHANGGTGTMSNSSHTYGTGKALTANKYTRTGYTFLGWSKTKNATTASYTDKQVVKGLTGVNGRVVNLYAVWKPITYKVSYNANGGTGTMANSSHTFGTAKALSANKFTRTGYIFLGWSKTKNATTASYTDCKTVSGLTGVQGKTVILYAVWKPITYKVSYNANGGKGTMVNSNHTYGTGKSLTANTFTRSGYTFLGWSRTKNATTATYTNKQVVKGLTGVQGKTVTLYAVWQKK